MTLSVKHATLSGVQDSGDGKLSSNAWNEGHAITGTANYLVGFDGTGNGTEINPATLATAITLSGDVTGSGTGSVATTIANGAVTLAKQANMATASVVYRKTAGSGAPEVQTLATLKTDLGLTGTNSGDQTITLTSDVTGSGTGSFVTTIANNAVSYAKMQDVSATQRVVGRNTAGAGDPEEVTATQVLDWLGATQGQVLYRGASAWSPLATGTSGQFLKTQGAAANPIWADAVTGVTTANGVSASLASGFLTFTLGAITPSSIAATGNITAAGTTNSFGPQTGTASSTFYLDSANAAAVLQGRFWSGGNPFNVGKIDFNGTANSPIYDTQNASNSHLFRLNGTNAFAVGPNGTGYVTGVGGAVTQATSRTTGVTLNKVCGAITLVSAAGTASWQSFTVTNSTVAATDTVRVVQKSGTDKNMIHVTAVGAGSFEITFATTGGTTTEQPVFNFSVIKAVAA